MISMDVRSSKILQNPSLNRDLEQILFSSDEIHLTYIKNKFGWLANTCKYYN